MQSQITKIQSQITAKIIEWVFIERWQSLQFSKIYLLTQYVYCIRRYFFFPKICIVSIVLRLSHDCVIGLLNDWFYMVDCVYLSRSTLPSPEKYEICMVKLRLFHRMKTHQLETFIMEENVEIQIKKRFILIKQK